MATTKNVRAKQFPAKEGEPETEVAKRSPDGADGTRYVREFIIGGPWADTEAAHTANGSAVVSEAIQRGLHPRGEVSFDGATDHGDGVSTVLTYSVETVPASVDSSPQETTTPRNVVEGEG